MQILKTRFSDEVISDIMASKWWEYDLPKLTDRGELTLAEDDIQGMLELLKQDKTAAWPRLKDNWYYLVPESDQAVHLYPVPANFAYAKAVPPLSNAYTRAEQQRVLLAQQRYEKTHPQRRTFHLHAATAT